jgi:uncharacterized membrane protein
VTEAAPPLTPSTAEPAAPATGPAASPVLPRPAPKPWEMVLRDGWFSAALVAYAVMALAMIVWGSLNPSRLEAVMMGAEDRSAHVTQANERASLLQFVQVSIPFALAGAAWVLHRERKRKPPLPVYWAPLVISFVGLPLMSMTMFEYRYPVFTGLVLLGIALAAAHAAGAAVRTHDVRFGDVSPKVAWGTLFAGWVVFTAFMGGLAYWRVITFHAEPYDLSWETNAVHNILHTGIPRTSVGAGSFYRGQLLPTNYADTHTPWIYYLYAPFYALYQDARTLVWLQAAAMGAGTFGVYLFARRWLRSNALATLFGLAYLLNPNVQTYCMHDVHANPLAIPMVMFTLGMMEAKRPRWALIFAFLTCIVREETSVYTAAVGLFWALDRASDRKRMRLGWITFGMGVFMLLFITQGVMVWAGGKPRYSHFTFYFDNVSIGSILKSYLLNPLGAVKLVSSSMRLEYMWLSLLPLGFLALFGWRAAYFVLIPMGLLFPAIASNFFVAGMNYSAPIVVPILVLSVVGARRFLVPPRVTPLKFRARRAALGTYVLATALGAGLLYGNVFAKTYKFEFGSKPFRQSDQYDYIGELGILRTLPPFTEKERLVWDVIRHVPAGVPIATSWRINPQLSNRAVSLLFPEDGSMHPPENLAKYIVIDRLPPLTFQTEDLERGVRADSRFRVFYENKYAVIFERK